MDSHHLHNLLAILLNSGRISDAIRIASTLSTMYPDYVYFKLVKNLTLPIIYDHQSEVDWYRNRFSQGLEAITQEISLETPEAVNKALLGIGRWTNFLLAYQGYNDLELQKKYGQFIYRIMAAKYPEWVKELPINHFNQDDKIRVGYVSGFLQFHSAARWALGWIKYATKEKFEVYCYYIGREPDFITEQFQQKSDVFYHIPQNLEKVCQQIIADKLHILVYTDLGMLPQATLMAGLRLAPVQCTSWGNTVTSGLPTIDYYLSNELMEPENAESHYSEQLIRLPNIGMSYPKPIIPKATKNRSDFQLKNDAIIYLSCQSLFKYLPQYDYIFAAIVSQVPQAQIVFISYLSDHVKDQFRRRLQRAFASVGLNSEDYCVMVPPQDWDSYCNLNLVSDIFLDTFSWSGGNSTFEAIACNLPVVTSPGEFMRGRNSYGILKMLGVTETIAKDADEYIKIAVRLGLDRNWRESIVEKIKHRHSYLYEDRTCVAALEYFYQSVVREGKV